MKIEIKTEKVLIGNKEGRKILEISGVLKESELPQVYFMDNPHCFINDNQELEIIGVMSGSSCIKEGKTYDEPHFKNILTDIKNSGKRLHIINKDRHNANNKWHGIEKIII